MGDNASRSEIVVLKFVLKFYRLENSRRAKFACGASGFDGPNLRRTNRSTTRSFCPLPSNGTMACPYQL